MRIGQGFDAHAFCAGAEIVLGGVRIPHDHGLAAHSDGDALLHALCDALLGAAGFGDLGARFPEETVEPGVDSRILLRRTAALLAADFELVNVDATIIAQQPKLLPFIGRMRRLIAVDLGLDEKCVNVKATTSDRLGFIGRGEGIAALAVALLKANGSARLA